MQATAVRHRTSTKHHILDSAQQLLQTRGYNAFSYSDISEVVGVRKASIHYHFPTKANLGQALLERYAEQFSQSLGQIRLENSAARERLVALVEIYAEMLERDRLCLAAMLGAGALTAPTQLRDCLS